MALQTFSPRDIQARVRGGDSAEVVAAETGWPLDKVLRYAEPMLAERAFIAEKAQAVEVRRSGGGATLQQAAAAALGVDNVGIEWDAYRREDGKWIVSATYREADGPPCRAVDVRPRRPQPAPVGRRRPHADGSAPVGGSRRRARHRRRARPGEPARGRGARRDAPSPGGGPRLRRRPVRVTGGGRSGRRPPCESFRLDHQHPASEFHLIGEPGPRRTPSSRPRRSRAQRHPPPRHPPRRRRPRRRPPPESRERARAAPVSPVGTRSSSAPPSPTTRASPGRTAGARRTCVRAAIDPTWCAIGNASGTAPHTRPCSAAACSCRRPSPGCPRRPSPR